MLTLIKKLFAPKKPPFDGYISDSLDIALKLIGGGDFTSAILILKDCIQKAPGEAGLYFALGEAYQLAGQKEPACQAFQDYLARDPDDRMGGGIRLFLLDRHAQPGAIPPEYVRRLFDGYAHRFERHLVESLQYAAPEIVARAVKSCHPRPFARVLDLGCGTGLCGAHFRDDGAIIDGVDISAAMLGKAREKGVFAGLHHSEINAFLENCADRYDLVVSADVFVYVGMLEKTFQGVSNILMPGGLFAFTVQKLAEGEVVLGPDHRFWHSRAYVERCAADAGLDVIACDDCTLRTEFSAPVKGAVFVCKK